MKWYHKWLIDKRIATNSGYYPASEARFLTIFEWFKWKYLCRNMR